MTVDFKDTREELIKIFNDSLFLTPIIESKKKS